MMNYHYLYRFIGENREGFPARNAQLSAAGPGAIAPVSGVSIFETAETPENAEAFVRFPLTKLVQQYFAGSAFGCPLVAEFRPSALPTPREEIGQPDVTLTDRGDLAGTPAMPQKVGALS